MARGYAGNGEGMLNPNMESQRDVGPIPRGRYTIVGTPVRHPTIGAYTLRLEADSGNNMYGRSGFLIHGDSINNPGHASHGCIIMPRAIRETIWESGDRELEVVR